MDIEKVINLSDVEEKLYGISGQKYNESISLGNNLYADISIHNYTGGYITNASEVLKNIKIRINFRENKNVILRLDNCHGDIHYDIPAKNKKHIFYTSIGDSNRLSQIIGDTFDKANEILKQEYPDMKIKYW